MSLMNVIDVLVACCFLAVAQNGKLKRIASRSWFRNVIHCPTTSFSRRSRLSLMASKGVTDVPLFFLASWQFVCFTR
uniref:Putative secreted protein n=1 Tax=Anopheles marajoara TaxID=58244 RepID=A0A2M4CCN9_9DIPT